MSKPMLWGYFFTHKEPELLKKAKDLLNDRGYRFVDIYISENEYGQRDMWWLHVEKQEIHTPETLNFRNQELSKIALGLQIDSYDGWDVGPINE